MTHTDKDLEEQATRFFSNTFYTNGPSAGWHINHGSDFHGYLYISSALLTFLAFLIISTLVFKILLKQTTRPLPKFFLLLAVCILISGSTYLMDVILLWWPAHNLSTLIRVGAALLSVSTLFSLNKALPFILNLQPSQQLDAEIEQRKKAEKELQFQLTEHKKTKELLKIKERFINLAAHELKTPLTSLRGYMQMASNISKEDPGQQQNILGKAEQQSQRLVKLVNDLFEATKPEVEQLPLESEAFKLAVLLQECANKTQAVHPDFEISLEGPENLEISADREKIEQVVCNLLSNAVKYSPKNTKATIKTEILGNEVCVTIIDFGIGIAAERLSSIFDRDDEVGQGENQRGLGLGLYLSKRIVEQHKGKMGVESILQEGSQFWFRIPRHQ